MKILNVNMKVVAFSFLFATTFWFFRAMRADHSANVDFPLSIDYDHSSLVQGTGFDDEIIINVTGSGWGLLWADLGFVDNTINLRYSELASKQFLLGQQMFAVLSDQISNFDVNYIYSDTVRFNFDKKVSKVVSFKLQSNRIDPTHFTTGETSFVPKNITLTGAKSVLRSIQDTLIFEPAILEQDDKRVSVKLKNYFPQGVSLSEDRLFIEYTVESIRKEEVILSVLIDLSNDSIPSFKQQLSVDCTVREDLSSEQLKSIVKSALSLDSIDVENNAVIPQVNPLPNGVVSVVVRPSRIYLARHEAKN